MYKALTSFAGLISMTEGEIRDISDPSLIDDLTRCKYIVQVKTKKRRDKDDAD